MRQLFAGIDQGAFREVKPRGGTGDFLVHAGRGTAFGDPDNDGDVDIVVLKKDPPRLCVAQCCQEEGTLDHTSTAERPRRECDRRRGDRHREGIVAVGSSFSELWVLFKQRPPPALGAGRRQA